MTAPDFKAMGDPLNDRLPPRRSGNRADAADQVIQSLLTKRRLKDLARIERTCVHCGVPTIHCQCLCNCTEEGQPYCGDPECDIDFCEDCGDEYSAPCPRHAEVGRP